VTAGLKKTGKELNPSLKVIHPKDKVQYRKAKMQRQITGWRLLTAATLASRYNVGDSSYAEKLNYVKALLPHGRATAHSFAAIAVGACMFVGCARPVAPQATAPAPSPERKLLDGRQALLDALGAQQVFTAPRMVVHVAHVCNLVIAGAVYPVVDLQELVKGAMVPRGVNAILVLDSALHLLRRIEYTTERPLFCRDDRLYVWGDLAIDGVHGEGNEITFGPQAEVAKLVQVEANDVPAPTVGVEPPR
jgi:hypothetical protein